jgi:lipoprotein-anchoring transpeptidase ErfK/SrfK
MLGGRTVSAHIDVSLSGHTLTYYENGHRVKTYPVGIGKMAAHTPKGFFKIINKEGHPGGPYGAFWMGLSRKHYGIHGTNDPSSIGKSVSHGCIRMRNRDVLELAKVVPLQTPVRILP